MRTEHDTVDETITVVIAAPRGSLATDPGSEAGFVVVAVAADEGEALAAVHDARPDVVVVHSRIGTDEVVRSLCRSIRAAAPASRPLAVVGDDAAERGHQLILAGASSLAPGPSSTDLAAAIIGLARGESELPPAVAAAVLADLDRWAERSADPLHPPPTLTATEREVLIRRAGGQSTIEIADAHRVTPHLVRVHAGYAVAKLHRYVLDESVSRR